MTKTYVVMHVIKVTLLHKPKYVHVHMYTQMYIYYIGEGVHSPRSSQRSQSFSVGCRVLFSLLPGTRTSDPFHGTWGTLYPRCQLHMMTNVVK